MTYIDIRKDAAKSLCPKCRQIFLEESWKQMGRWIEIGRDIERGRILRFIGNHRDKGNVVGGGFSAGICLSDLLKLLNNPKEISPNYGRGKSGGSKAFADRTSVKTLGKPTEAHNFRTKRQRTKSDTTNRLRNANSTDGLKANHSANQNKSSGINNPKRIVSKKAIRKYFK